MIAELKFNLPEEEYEFGCAIHGEIYRNALTTLQETIRGRLKYGDHADKDEPAFLQHLRDVIAESVEVEML